MIFQNIVLTTVPTTFEKIVILLSGQILDRAESIMIKIHRHKVKICPLCDLISVLKSIFQESYFYSGIKLPILLLFIK